MSQSYKRLNDTAGSGSGTDDKRVKVTTNDTTPGFLNDKIESGTDISVTIENSGGNEKLRITSTASSSKYSQSFNATTDWTLSGSFYIISVLVSTHNRGVNPTVFTYELDTGIFQKVDVDLVSVNNSGDVTIRVPQTPDLRFPGKIIIS